MGKLTRGLGSLAVVAGLVAIPAVTLAEEPDSMTPQAPRAQGDSTGNFPYPVDPYAYWPNFTQIRSAVESQTNPIVGPLLVLGKQPESNDEIITEGPIDVDESEE